MASDSAAEHAPLLGGQRPSGAKRQVGLPEVITCHLARLQAANVRAQPAAGRERLLPTPDTGSSPERARPARRPARQRPPERQGPGRGARTLTTPAGSATAAAWGEYEPAIRRWEHVLGQPAPPPAEPGPGGRPRLTAEFAEWMMGIPELVTGVGGLPRTAQLRVIGNGVVPHQAAAALRLLIEAAAVPGAPSRAGTSMRAAA